MNFCETFRGASGNGRLAVVRDGDSQRFQYSLRVIFLSLRIPTQKALHVGRADFLGFPHRLAFSQLRDDRARRHTEAAAGREITDVLDPFVRPYLQIEGVHVAARIGKILARGAWIFHLGKSVPVGDELLKLWKIHYTSQVSAGRPGLVTGFATASDAGEGTSNSQRASPRAMESTCRVFAGKTSSMRVCTTEHTSGWSATVSRNGQLNSRKTYPLAVLSCSTMTTRSRKKSASPATFPPRSLPENLAACRWAECRPILRKTFATPSEPPSRFSSSRTACNRRGVR